MLGRPPGALIEKLTDLSSQNESIRPDPTDEMRIALAQKAEAEREEARSEHGSVLMRDLAVGTDRRWNPEPAEIAPIARRPDDGADVFSLQRKPAWRLWRKLDGGDGIGIRIRAGICKGIDALEQALEPGLRAGNIRGEVI